MKEKYSGRHGARRLPERKRRTPVKINFEEFEVVEPKTWKKDAQIVSIYGNGGMAVNEELIRAVKTNCFEIRLDSRDCGRMLLIPGGSTITNMGKTHRIKNYAVMERLARKKIKFPAYYVGEWSEENQCRIGELSVINPNRSGGRIKK